MEPFNVELVGNIFRLSTIGVIFGIVLNVAVYFVGAMIGVVTKVAR